jgi:hypothetical protein
MSLENRKRLDFAQNYFKQRIKEVFAVFTASMCRLCALYTLYVSFCVSPEGVASRQPK